MSDQIVFKTVGIVCKPGSKPVWRSAIQLNAFLQDLGCETLILGNFKSRLNYQSTDPKDMGKRADLILTLGGDGTFLYGARTFAPFDIPVTGINLGRVGYLLSIEEKDAQKCLGSILKGHYQISNHLLIKHNKKVDDKAKVGRWAVNDIVIKPIDMHMMEASIEIDGKSIMETRSDGIIISTPIGSTSYSQSAGGPILNRSAHALVITTISPHFRQSVSHVCSADQKIIIHLNAQKSKHLKIYCDGMFCRILKTPNIMKVFAYKHKLKILENR